MEQQTNTRGFGFYLKVVIGLALAGFVVGVLSGSITWFSEDTPIMIINDMDDQFKVKPQVGSTFYTDRKSFREPLPNTVPIEGSSYPLDKPDFDKADSLIGNNPLDISTPEKRQYILSRGKNRYEAFCTPCHNYDGQGNGTVVARGFPNPPKHRDEVTIAKTDAQPFHTKSASPKYNKGTYEKNKPNTSWRNAAIVLKKTKPRV